MYGEVGPKGTDIINLEDPENPEVIYRWRIENQDLHQRTGGMDVKYFKLDGRYYVVQSLQFGQGGPNPDLGAVILDVTGLPDPSTVREVARLREPEMPGGFHNIFIYKHSDGRVLLITTIRGPFAHVYDMARPSTETPRTLSQGGFRFRSRRSGRGADAATTTSTRPIIRTPARTVSTEAAPAATTSTTSAIWTTRSWWSR